MTIEQRMKNNRKKAVELLNKNIDLEYKLMLRKAKSITEEEINFGTKKNPNPKHCKVMRWKEFFKDEDYPNDKSKGVWVERSRIIEIEGKKSDGYRELQYYTV